ncbi:hypothetical protein BESB_084680 [Besnoitia besnoiti]|uniref:Uncharacterized protein n=1 Tax=Besnoitia besnoiti TaxID=94643 RepID=A0A2A9M5P9_BESBE|nr:hypothetical protein BESB_084680 [Besnoitia besnoiti]PFH33269.1 hypothetical protein BESB_084680 [Besnoitia besnoiti]
MALSAYFLRALTVTYTARNRSSMTATIENLRNTILWMPPASSSSPPSSASSSPPSSTSSLSPSVLSSSPSSPSSASSCSAPWPVPRRIGRRQWRVTYLKSPFKYKYALRHYVFEDHRYAFSFYDVENVQEVLSAALGAMAKETCCSCRFSWHFAGRPQAALPAAPRLVASSLSSSSAASSASAVPAEDSLAGGAEEARKASRKVFPVLQGHCPADKEFIRRALEEEQAVERIRKKLDKKTLQWFPGKTPWAPK